MKVEDKIMIVSILSGGLVAILMIIIAKLLGMI